MPRVPESSEELTKDNSVTLQLATDPANMQASPKYKTAVLILKGGESVRTMLQWKRDVTKVLHGMSITTGPNQVLMVQSLLVDTPLTLFETKVGELATNARQAAANAAETANPGSGAAILAQPFTQHLTTDHVLQATQYMLAHLMPR